MKTAPSISSSVLRTVPQSSDEKSASSASQSTSVTNSSLSYLEKGAQAASVSSPVAAALALVPPSASSTRVELQTGSNGAGKSPSYNFYLPSEIDKRIAQGKKLALFTSGWAEYPKDLMSYHGTFVQLRSLVSNYIMAYSIVKKGGEVDVTGFTTVPFTASYRKYLYTLCNNGSTSGFEAFDKKVFDVVCVPRNPADHLDAVTSVAENTPAEALSAMQEKVQALKAEPDTELVGMSVYKTNEHWQNFAEQLGLEYLCVDADLNDWGTKHGCRQVFRDAEVPHARGTYELVRSEEGLANDIYSVLTDYNLKKVIVKLDEGCCGDGNVMMDFSADVEKIGQLSKEEAVALIAAKIGELPEEYRAQLPANGAIIEEFFEGSGFCSPSVDVLIQSPDNIAALNGYDMTMGGEQGLAFKGIFGPLEWECDLRSMAKQASVGLAKKGVRDHAAVDFVVFRDPDGVQQAYAVEVNMRKSGGTVPYRILAHLTEDEALQNKSLHTFDHVELPGFKSLPASVWEASGEQIENDFFEWLTSEDFTYSHKTETGCVAHFQTLPNGEVGVTCIGDTIEEAKEFLDTFIREAGLYSERVAALLTA